MTAALSLGAGADVPAVRCENLVRIFSVDGGRGEGRVEVVALQGLDLHVDSGELVAIVGASGSGKSTLLTILSGLDTPSAGSARVAGHDLLSMGRAERVRYQRHTVGFVWQQTARNLLPYLTAAQNVSVPMAVTRMRRAERRERVHHLLDLLGVGEQADRRPSQLSGGSSSGWRSRWRSRTPRRCCSPTSPPASSTPRRPTRCSPPSARPTASSASPS